jgi:hypothetical protein
MLRRFKDFGSPYFLTVCRETVGAALLLWRVTGFSRGNYRKNAAYFSLSRRFPASRFEHFPVNKR